MYLGLVAQTGRRTKSDSTRSVQAKRLPPGGGHRIDLQLARHIYGVAPIRSAKCYGVTRRDNCARTQGCGVVEAVCADIGAGSYDRIVKPVPVGGSSRTSKESITQAR